MNTLLLNEQQIKGLLTMKEAIDIATELLPIWHWAIRSTPQRST